MRNPASRAAATAGLDRRRFLKLAAAGGTALGAGMVLAACGSSSSASTASSQSGFGSIALQLSWIKNVEFAGEYFATQAGYYKDAGFTSVKLLAGGGQTPTESVVLAGQALIGMSSIPEIAASVAKGAGLKVIAVCYQKNPFCLLSLKEKTPISSIAELKGKRVGVQSDNQVAFEGFLKANNLTTKDVDVVATQYSIAPLESGKYDAQIAFTTNEVLLAKEDKFTPVVLPFADNGLSFATNPIFVTTDTLKNKRDLIKAFLTAEIRGWTAAIKNPTQSAKYAAEIYGKDQNLTVAEQTLEATAQNAQIVTADTNKNGLFTMTSALLDQTVSSLGDMGTKITADDLFDLSLLKEVYTEHPELIVNLPVTTA